MENITEDQLSAKEEIQYAYASFWERVGADVIDCLILLPLVFLTIYNATVLKSTPIMILGALIAICYKPLLEYRYNATLGKMAIGLSVTNTDYEKASLQAILLRNIFHIIPGICSFVISLILFQSADLGEISTYREYASYMNASPLHIINWAAGSVFLADVIFFLQSDVGQTLHDKIGGTYVVKRARPYGL